LLALRFFGIWAMLPCAVLGAGFLLRLFMIQHDCGHGAFFRSRQANDILGSVNRSAATLNIPAGREGIKDYILDVLHKALADIKVEIFDQIAEEDTVVTRKSITGIQIGEFLGRPANNEHMVMHAIDIVKLRDGQYVEHWRYGQVVS
jgi:predicted ester cyclase